MAGGSSQPRRPAPGPSKLGRRCLTLPGYVLGWLLWCAALPLLLPLALLVDALRRPRTAVRIVLFATFYLSMELAGLAISAGLWLWKRVARTSPERWQRLHFRLEAWWGTALFRAVVRIFGLRVEVEGDREAELGRGPYLLLVRHSSIGDTLLASALVTGPHRVQLRYVLKRELLWDPCLDVVGNRIPNVFVDRGSDDSASEIQRIAALGRNLGPDAGVLIYPEGTRFSESKQRRVLERLRKRGDTALHEYASSLTHTLPPRAEGTLALLDAAPEADVVLCAHTGFETAATVTGVWSGSLVGQTIRARFRRIPRSELPADRDGQAAWLRNQWKWIDEWVADRMPGIGATATQTPTGSAGP